MSTVEEYLSEVRGYSANELATMAGCHSPDAPDSPGAVFLTDLRSDFTEAVESGAIMWCAPDHYDSSRDQANREMADGAPDVYTHSMWEQFVDLCAYQQAEEMVEEYGAYPTMDDWARACLLKIAETLIADLCRELDEQCATDDPDEEDPDIQLND